MQKIACIIVFFLIFTGSAQAADDKEIYFWLDKQMGAAYENGQLVRSFRIISGYDGLASSQDGSRTYYKPTPKETHRIISKTVYGYSKKYNAEMPYAMQFKRGYYIHAWSWDEPLPAPGHPYSYSSHGCISVNLPVAEWLFGWINKNTPIYIWGEWK
jgi:lipoprotein-anchoring transpeptidase ErfK/SrfK